MFKFGHVDMEEKDNPIVWDSIPKDDFNLIMQAKKRSVHQVEELELAATQIKNDQEMLIAVTQFMDAYEEVLVWNKLIRQKKLDKNVTSRHREMDIALYHGKVCKMQREKKYSPRIHALIYEHGHRNDK